MPETIEKIAKPRPVYEIVLDRLRSDIVRNKFRLGEKISENHLSELYGVTKAPIRAAYMRLVGEGLIEIRPQAGTFVFSPDPDELRALCELRVALEVEAARLAMERDQPGLAQDMARILAGMEEALATRSQETYLNLDTDLHLALFTRSNSSMLEQAYHSQVNSRFVALRYRFSALHSHNVASMGDHRQMCDAVAAGDTDRLVELTRAHINNTKTFYSKLDL